MAFRIGNAEVKNSLILGPMAGVTDRPFRVLCHEMGAGLVSMEMVSANALKYGNRKTFDFIDIDEREHPVSLQLFGPDPDSFSIAIEKILNIPYDILDINMGCPMPKIVNNGEGSALMRKPDLAEAIVRRCVSESSRPVTVKIRAGFNEEERNAVELAKRIEQAGAAAIAVHGRTREQYYTGRADWNIIREVKEAVRIPVIGNGDVRCAADALRMREETGCDFVMIARGAQGNPWIFRECAAAFAGFGGGDSEGFEGGDSEGFEGGDSEGFEEAHFQDQDVKACGYAEGASLPRPSIREIHDMMLRHARMQTEMKDSYLAVCQMRKHVAWYTTGLPGAAALRAAINKCGSYEELEMLLSEWLRAAE